MDQGPPHKTRQSESNRKESGEESQAFGTGEIFLNRIAIADAVRSRIDKEDLIKIFKLQEGKEKCQYNKMATERMEKDLYKSYIKD